MLAGRKTDVASALDRNCVEWVLSCSIHKQELNSAAQPQLHVTQLQQTSTAASVQEMVKKLTLLRSRYLTLGITV